MGYRIKSLVCCVQDLWGNDNEPYEIIIHWSEDDQAFVHEVPALPGCMAHGATCEQALAQAKEAMLLWVESARAD